MWDSESESAGGRDYSNGVLTSSKHAVKTDGFEQRGKSWYEILNIFYCRASNDFCFVCVFVFGITKSNLEHMNFSIILSVVLKCK